MGCTCCRGTRNESFLQTLVILRHSERRDQVDPSFLETEEHKEWPHDTPLTEAGIKLAQDVGSELKDKHENARFSVIVSSPYRRCLQTAAEIAKIVQLPVIIDQELGEVWDRTMPSDHPPHRSPLELVEMAKELGIDVQNPVLDSGGFKLFGKQPRQHPEQNRDGQQRCFVRVEHYIRESSKNKQNYVIVSHAPAVAAMCDIFQHGLVDIEKLEYCAMVCASRLVQKDQLDTEQKLEKSVFKEQWSVEDKRIRTGLNLSNDENDHEQACNESLDWIQNRLAMSSCSDLTLTEILKDQDKGVSKGDRENGNVGNRV